MTASLAASLPAMLAAALLGWATHVGLHRDRGALPSRRRHGRWALRVRPPWVSARERRADAEAVLEACDALAAELRAGRPPGESLASAADTWAPLAVVAQALHLGADVPESLRRLAGERPGAADLRLVGAAWEVAQSSGHGLARALSRTARGIRMRRRTRRIVESELASARATARLVCLLPVAVLLAGSGAGERPWTFLFNNPVGWACLVGGLALMAAGLAWIEGIARRAAPP